MCYRRCERHGYNIQQNLLSQSNRNVYCGYRQGSEPMPVATSKLSGILRQTVPYLIQVVLLDLVCPMMTCLMHDWAHFPRFLIFSIVEDIFDTQFHVRFQ